MTTLYAFIFVSKGIFVYILQLIKMFISTNDDVFFFKKKKIEYFML